ncbi:MAG: enoyl-CoA hydratase/isomerase family protein [Pseudomonadota bacterium]
MRTALGVSPDDPSERLLSPRELAGLALEPGWVEQDPANRRVLVVDLEGEAPAGLGRVCDWLARQPVPVVGFGRGGAAPLRDIVDVRVAGEAELARVLSTIRHNPTASAVLVQVLRSVGHLEVHEALTLESLAYATLQAGAEFAAWLADRGEPRAATRPAEKVVLLRREGERLEIVLNDPGNHNAMSVPMRDALTGAFELVAMDPEIAAVDVSANGACFSAGGDLAEFGTRSDAAAAHMIRMMRLPSRHLAAHADRYTFHVHRACIGAGVELPAFAGRLVATQNAYFQLPELRMGLIPGAGGCVSISRRIGRQRTAYMALTGKRIPARRALEWGLVDAIEG